MPNVWMPNVWMPNVCLLNVHLPKCLSAKHLLAKCVYDKMSLSQVSVISDVWMPNVWMPNVCRLNGFRPKDVEPPIIIAGTNNKTFCQPMYSKLVHWQSRTYHNLKHCNILQYNWSGRVCTVGLHADTSSDYCFLSSIAHTFLHWKWCRNIPCALCVEGSWERA